jgi:hypothetical protein
LIKLLNDSSSNIRLDAANALVSLYKSGKLDDENKRLILAQKSNITKCHLDKTEQVSHFDIDRSNQISDCSHMDDAKTSHQDIGVVFPV